MPHLGSTLGTEELDFQSRDRRGIVTLFEKERVLGVRQGEGWISVNTPVLS
jgi:hypothetical protein